VRAPPRALPRVTAVDHGGLTVYRVWHPSTHFPTADALRTYGPIFRFDPHRERRLPIDDPAHPPVWYGGEAAETAVRETLDRTRPADHPRVVEVCVRHRLAALRLHSPTELVDLTAHAGDLGCDDDLGDRAEVDYRDTRAWARAVHAQLGPDGLRYHSAYHRDADGGRAGVNVCLWNPDRPPGVVSDVAATSPGAWQRLRTMLVRRGAAPQVVHGCRRCR
jgi:hypothetical protein